MDGRKVHHGLIPRIGGMAFVPSAMAAFALTAAAAAFSGYDIWKADGGAMVSVSSAICFLVSSGLIYAEGTYDDIKGVGYKVKFLVHFLCATLLVLSGTWLDNLYGLFGLYEIEWYVGMPLTVLFFMYVVSAINLIDGIDGLCAGLAIIAFSYSGMLFYFDNALLEAMLSFSMLGALACFFRYNAHGKAQKHDKLFMGDCGSQTTGLLLALLAVRYCTINKEMPCFSGNALILSLSPLVIPCLDVLRVMAGRIGRGCNPFLPDQTHIHHLLLAKGWGQRKTRNFIFGFAILIIAADFFLCRKIDANLVLATDVVLYAGLIRWITHSVGRK